MTPRRANQTPASSKSTTAPVTMPPIAPPLSPVLPPLWVLGELGGDVQEPVMEEVGVAAIDDATSPVAPETVVAGIEAAVEEEVAEPEEVLVEGEETELEEEAAVGEAAPEEGALEELEERLQKALTALRAICSSSGQQLLWKQR